MTKQDLINFCLTFPDVYEDYPFDTMADPAVWATIRHSTNKKIFATIYEREGKECINLKCDPFEAEMLRQTFKGVTPGYHMNKQHWNTITMGNDVNEEEIKRQIRSSYDLTKPKGRSKK